MLRLKERPAVGVAFPILTEEGIPNGPRALKNPSAFAHVPTWHDIIIRFPFGMQIHKNVDVARGYIALVVSV